MKLHELAKDLGFKSHEVLAKAKELGLQIGGISSNLKDDEVEILTKAYEGVERPAPPEEKVETDTIPENLKKGAFIGIAFDGKEFNVVTTKLTLEQVKRFETEVLSKHTNVYGAMLEMQKKIAKFINQDTIKTFK